MIFDALFKNRQKPLQPFKTSPGKLRQYLQCPFKYKLIHIDNKQSSSNISPYLTFDTIMNRVLESMQKKLVKNRNEVSKEHFLEELSRAWKSDGFVDQDEEKLFRADAESAANNMTRWFVEDASNKVATHQYKPAIGIFAPWYPRPLTLWTRIDRVEIMPSGKIRLIDFKSGAREVTSSELRDDLGVRIQAAAGRELFGKDVDSFAVVYIRTGHMISIPLEELDLDFIAADVKSIVKDIQNKRFEPKPGPLCSVCEFMEECLAWRKKLPWKPAGETRQKYGERLRLSYSKMSLFERCPRAYYKLYNEKIPPKPQPFFSFGSCIHAVMEHVYDPASRQRPTLEHLQSLLEEQWRFFRSGYRSIEENEQYFAEGAKILETYYRQFIENQPFRPATHIESYFELPVGNNAIMTGFIDRIDKLPKGGSIILDYKTEPTERSQEDIDKDLQLTLYYWAGREFLNKDIHQLGLFMMKHNKLMLTTRTPDDIPPLLERINVTVRRIQATTTFEPRINKYCLSCDHLIGCPLEEQIRSDKTLRSMEFSDDSAKAGMLGDDL